MDYVAKNLNPAVITKADDLRRFCDGVLAVGRFAFDTEFVMEESYAREACLIQMATEDEVALIDPLADLDTSVVWDLVADPEVEVVVHAGAEDMALCHQLTGKVPANVFDLQLAAGLVSCDYPLSLARLVHGLVRIRLHKSQTLTDWRRRPLSAEQCRYAVEDVAYLPAAYRLLVERLERTQRLDWARQEFAKFELADTYSPPKQDRLFRLKGLGSMSGQKLAVAMELLEARERLASKFDRPARVLLKDHLLVEIARNGWVKVDQIGSLRGMQLRRSAIGELADAVKRGLAVPVENCPSPPASVEETPEEQALTALLTAVLRDYCQRHSLAYPLLATKQSIRQVLQHQSGVSPIESPLQRGWRNQAVGGMIADLLEGRATIRVTGKGKRRRLCVDKLGT